MAMVNIGNDVKQAMIQDWKYGKYKNYNQIAKAYGISPMTSKKIILESKAVQGSESEEFKKLTGNHLEATKTFIDNPNEQSLNSLKEATKLLPASSLTEMLEMIENTNDIVSSEIVDAISLKLLQSNIIRTNVVAHQNITDNKKTIVISGGKAGSYTKEVPLDSGDLKNYIEISDKSLIAMGLADRFAPKNDVNVMTQVNADGEKSSIANNINSFYEEKKIIEIES